MDSEWLERQYKREDIISRMPDDVLSHIISRLEAKDAVKTCVLSTRWKNVWTLMYNFYFNLDTDGKGNRRTLFVNFVELVLRRSQSKSIQNFHLKTYYGFEESDAIRLIELLCWAADHNVCSLILKFFYAVERPMIRLPQSILTCKSLVKLSLGFSDFVMDIPDCTVCFSCLKFLSIYIDSPNSNSLQKLFRSCPILEELKIKGSYPTPENVVTIDIDVPTLKKLKIQLVIDYFDIWLHTFVVRASNLEYLDLGDYYLPSIVVGETPFLNKVILGNGYVHVWLLNESSEDEATMCATEFFRAISSTRFLSLDIKYATVGYLNGNLPFFRNLIYLDLGIDIVAGFALLVEFFNNSPNLEVLNLEVLGLEKEVEEGWYNNQFELGCVPSCMLFHLKEIYFFLEETLESYMEGAIKCLLENCKVLERFSVETDTCSCTDEQEILNRILNFPRASPICEIEFVDYSCKEKLQSKFNKYR
ncbi:hypothetical protein Dsin_031913 [Dipteronia sinensis]|uniref:F-box domain-containing protein n=1 Tax=Dipteronia sinensis TaxID=43782 RepID=A0AAD9ZMK3_9ROSI|nr:hypothetical protein Dsin_031913 [Dipteronia sinensis]